MNAYFQCALIGRLSMDPGSIAIIGGADEPAQIIVTSAVDWPLVIAGLVLAAAVAIGLILYFKRKK